MGHWDEIRSRARRRRAEVLRESGHGHAPDSLISASDLLEVVEEVTGVPRIPLAAHDPLLYGAEAWLGGDPQDEVIYFNEGAPGWRAAFYQVHEYAHLWLHHAHGAEGCDLEDVDPSAYEAAQPVGMERVQGYGPKERREREANVFAREFLLPADALAAWYLQGNLGLYAIASALGLPPSLVSQQLAYALLTPGPAAAPPPDPKPAASIPLDESQRRAAHAERGPVLVEAGPGTGKTRTLVGRILYLLDKGVESASILALTFSNKAAEEMRSRVAAVAPRAAPLIWMGTFHAFGFELLRKYGELAGLPPRPELANPVEAVLALEQALPELKLEHYIDLHEPAAYLQDVLGAISRAKDELVGPDEYEALGRKMLDDAATPEERERAEKALEVAKVYRYFDSLLRRDGLLDFGDLIFRAVTLLREHPTVRESVRASFKHILVDEYQDVNRASGLLLKELAGAGEGLWAVGDARQAIYRFRGAAPANMRLFTSDFPGASVIPLEVNYRSQPAIVAAFAQLAPLMKAVDGGDFAPWRSHRADDGGAVLMKVAEDGVSEAAGLAREIVRRHQEGVPFREQAVLCRSHAHLARLGAALEAAGVPVLYLGDLFEREEVRDLLAMLDLASGPTCEALLRVARFPEYAVPFRDVRHLLSISRERKLPFRQALDLARASGAISAEGEARLSLLAAHLEASTKGVGSAWYVLSRYLFAESGYLQPILADLSPRGEQKRLALFQFLQFALDQSRRTLPEGSSPTRYLLDYVRHLEMFGEARSVQQVPDWAEGIDALRLMTIHASKGLEFSAVYLPRLGAGYFPARSRTAHCPPPHGLLASDDDWHEEEEECLFFVALSRARDVLCLSRAKRYGLRNSKPSRFLSLISARLSQDPDGPVSWPAIASQEKAAAEATPAPHDHLKPRYTLQMLELYMKCPRRFYYDYMLDLGGEDEAAYARFYRCVYGVLDWIGQERTAGRKIAPEEAVARLVEVWADEGPGEHVHEAFYRAQAEEMLSRALAHYARAGDYPERPSWEVPLSYGRIAFTPDRIELAPDEAGKTLRVQRLRTGRPSKSEKAADVYGLFYRAAASEYPKATVDVQTLYLSSGQVESVKLDDTQVETRIARYEQAMQGIAGRDFHPEPSDRRCPRCPHYFICPHGE